MVSSVRNNKTNYKGKKKPIATKKIDQWQNAKLKKLWAMSKPELKEYRAGATGLSITTAGYLQEFTKLITKGTAASNRIGDKIKIKSINIRGVVQAGDNNNLVRLMLVRQSAGNVPLLAQFPGVIEFPNTDFIYAYKDRVISVTPHQVDGSNIAYPQKIFNFTITFPSGYLISYDQSDNPLKQLDFYAVSDSVAVPNPTLDYEFIINFYDN